MNVYKVQIQIEFGYYINLKLSDRRLFVNQVKDTLFCSSELAVSIKIKMS